MEDSRRSAAAQFYMDDVGVKEKPNYNKVVSLLNEATMCPDPQIKTELLTRVKDLVLNKESTLLKNFIDEILAFQTDRNAEVRKFVVAFIEDAIKKDCEILPQVIVNIQMLLEDRTPQVQKRVVQCITQLYRIVLMWLARASTISDEMQMVWSVTTNMKGFIINMVDSENDGLRTQIVKFLEMLVLLQTYPEADSLRRNNDFSLEDIPLTLKVARRRKLEEEAMTVFDLMIKFHGSHHISSANLMACMGSLTTIAKLRPLFMGKVVAALETLHMNLPPTLSTSQVNSVRKHLKMQLLNLLRHPASSEYHTNITTLLTDLGATTHEVMKAFPKLDEIKKRTKKSNSDVPSKKVRLEEPQPISESAIDITEAFIIERLSPELAANLVITGMASLPDTMPAVFSATYTPIAAAGTQGQIKHVARLLATQLNAAGLGPGASIAKSQKIQVRSSLIEDEDEESAPATVASIPIDDGMDEDVNASKVPAKPLKLEMFSLTQDVRESLQVSAIQRVLKAEKSAITGGVSNVRTKLISTIASSFGEKVRSAILEFILADLKNQINLALSWAYEEYSFLQGFTKRAPNQLEENLNFDKHYDNYVCTLINAVINNKEMKDREAILKRVCLEVPLITDDITALLKEICTKEVFGLNIIYNLVLMRPPKQLAFLSILLENTSHQDSDIREAAINHVVELYSKDDMKSHIEEHAIFYFVFLKAPTPPKILFGVERGRPQVSAVWTDDAVKACLYLYLALLPIKQELIHELARVYIQTVADVKRTILRVVENPVRTMGMDSPELLKLVEECPKGSETLVTRLIHILTDKSAPSMELVARVRELYHTRVSDVRFLIPVLNGLTKNEIIAALPKLIKLNPIVVKEVFNRLLGSSNEVGAYSSPITPSELLIALHTIDPTKCELKTVIKATSLCFSDKQAYTQEVLAVVMQHLMEVTPLPTLLMRTVIQALSLYPRLIGFVMNILQRLILKQVWRQKKVWEGFIKCCQRAQPHSYQVLLQLPAQQLIDVFREAPDMKKPLLDHIMEFTENQRAHIPQNIMDILLGPSSPVHNEFHIKEEPLSPPQAPELTIDMKEEAEDIPRIFSEPAPPGLD
ncbi:hypothetical protein O3M35_011802 [Rhynocoris fuscipes]|uniref:Symplekin n=1 Tax=Rhynocoris fuscipes TaxID=488301 RepID=A0AAW1CXZ7_9HEMI